MNDRVVTIGGASGAWGDSPMGAPQLLTAGVGYLMMDYLAEVTMSLLAAARLKDPEAGYPDDFVTYLKPHLADIARRGTKVVSNAGGVNPQACKRAFEKAALDAGVVLSVAVVEGDDLLSMADALRAEGTSDWASGAAFPARLLTANAYLGALPIAAALGAGADIVITGRCADSALALGILIHEFGWAADDFDRLAAGSLVGHLLECGPQACGGLFTDWEQVPDWAGIGYPIAECHADGGFVLTKPAGSGGLVTPATVAEQVLYEIGDPADYVLPDVRADFSHVRLEQQGEHRVRVRGARGREPTAQYKVSCTHADGWRATALVAIIGRDAAAKARRTGEALVERARRAFGCDGQADFLAVHLEVLGAEASYGAQSRALDAREVVLRLVVDHTDRRALDAFAREIGSAGLAFAPGMAALIGGRPKAAPVVRLFTFLIDKARVAKPRVQVGAAPAFEIAAASVAGDAKHAARAAAGLPDAAARTTAAGPPASVPLADVPLATVPLVTVPLVTVPLWRVAHARSGDKGDSSNIAIFCRRPEYLDHLRRVLTAERIGAHFSGSVDGPVTRYEAPGLAAFNFVLERALGGGGMASRRIDPLGKAYGQRALEIEVSVPAAWPDAQGDVPLDNR